MLQTKFFVFPKRLCNHFKFGISKFDEKADRKVYKDWRKLRFKKLSSFLSDTKTQSEDLKFEKNQFLLQSSSRQKFFCPLYLKMEFAVQNYIPTRRNQNRYKTTSLNEIKRTQSGFLGITLPKELILSKIPINYEIRHRYKTDCMGNDMSQKLAKEAPASNRTSLVMYEAGKCFSKAKISNCESKRKSKYKNCIKPKNSIICDPDERYAKISTSNLIKECESITCPSQRKKKCIEEMKAITPPQENEDPYSSDCSRESNTDSRFNQIGTKRKRKMFAKSGSKNGSSKQCSSVHSGSSCCPSPNKTNSISKCLTRSRSSPQTSFVAQKCPSSVLDPITCSKQTAPCQLVNATGSPPYAYPSSPDPAPKTSCGSPSCSPSPCSASCLPSPPSPSSPPPPSPKMEALQFDPVSKILNFYMLNAPTCIRKDEVLVQIVYSGVCSNDFSIMEGKFAKLCKPVIMGHEFSGIACVVGSGVSHVKSGDCIAINPYTACQVCKYCARGQFGACTCQGLNNTLGIHKDGGWAEFIVVNKTQVYQIPQCLNLGQAVLIRPLSCILNAVSKLDIPFGSDIVIQGTGVTGCLWASLLHMQGHRNVIACDISEYKRKIFQRLDLKFCIVPPEKLCDVKADIVIDCTGSGSSIERGIRMLNSQGQLLIFGTPPPDEAISIQPNIVAKKELKILSVITNTNCFGKTMTLAEMMGCRYLDFEKLGIQTFRLGQYEGAFNMKKCGEISKIVFKIQNSK